MLLQLFIYLSTQLLFMNFKLLFEVTLYFLHTFIYLFYTLLWFTFSQSILLLLLVCFEYRNWDSGLVFSECLFFVQFILFLKYSNTCIYFRNAITNLFLIFCKYTLYLLDFHKISTIFYYFKFKLFKLVM